MEKLDEFAIREVIETYERYIFNSRNRESDETIDVYVAALRKLAQTCNFCECLHDTLITDRIVLGVKSKQLRKRLLQERKLTLSKCADICRSSEATTSQLQAISGTDNEEINRLKQRDSRFNTSQRNKAEKFPHRKSKLCKFCGGEHVLIKRNVYLGVPSARIVEAEIISRKFAEKQRLDKSKQHHAIPTLMIAM